MDPLPHIESDPSKVETVIWFAGLVGGIALLAGAFFAYRLGRIEVAVGLGLLGSIGVSIVGIPIGASRRRGAGKSPQTPKRDR